MYKDSAVESVLILVEPLSFSSVKPHSHYCILYIFYSYYRIEFTTKNHPITKSWHCRVDWTKYLDIY